MLAGRLNSYSERINLRRFLRKNFVDRMVFVLTIVLVCLTVALAAYAVRSIRLELAETENREDSFEANLKPLLNSLNNPPAPNTKVLDLSPIAHHPLFGPIGSPNNKNNASQNKPLSTLPMSLVGTFIYEGQEPYAIIEEQKKKTQDVFLLNDMVFGEAKLIAIFPDRVDISRNGKIETLTLDQGGDSRLSAADAQGGVVNLGGDEYVVDENELDKALDNLPLLLTQARAVPYFKDGRAVGLRMFAIKGGSLFEKIGLQNGDVLKSVNGNSLADLSQALQLFQKLKDERSISLTMERGMVERDLKYSIR